MRHSIKQVLFDIAKHPADTAMLPFVNLMVRYDEVTRPEFQWAIEKTFKDRVDAFYSDITISCIRHFRDLLTDQDQFPSLTTRLNDKNINEFKNKLKAHFFNPTNEDVNSDTSGRKSFFEQKLGALIGNLETSESHYSRQGAAKWTHTDIRFSDQGLPKDLYLERKKNFDSATKSVENALKTRIDLFIDRVTKKLERSRKLSTVMSDQDKNLTKHESSKKTADQMVQAIMALSDPLRGIHTDEASIVTARISYFIDWMRDNTSSSRLVKDSYETLLNTVSSTQDSTAEEEHTLLKKTLAHYAIPPTEIYDEFTQNESAGNTLLHLAMQYSNNELLICLVGPDHYPELPGYKVKKVDMQQNIWLSTFNTSSEDARSSIISGTENALDDLAAVIAKSNEWVNLTEEEKRNKVRNYLDENIFTDKKNKSRNWFHPSILHAFANANDIELRIWMEDSNGRTGGFSNLIPYVRYQDTNDYSKSIPEGDINRRIDLLFHERNDNVFSVIEYHGYPNDFPPEDAMIYPYYQKYTDNDSCVEASLMNKLKLPENKRYLQEFRRERNQLQSLLGENTKKQEAGHETATDKLITALSGAHQSNTLNLFMLKNFTPAPNTSLKDGEGVYRCFYEIKTPNGNKALHHLAAAGRTYLSTIHLLVVLLDANPLECNADNIPVCEIYDVDGYTITHRAFLEKDLQLLTKLYSAGAKTNHRTQPTDSSEGITLLEMVRQRLLENNTTKQINLESYEYRVYESLRDNSRLYGAITTVNCDSSNTDERNSSMGISRYAISAARLAYHGMQVATTERNFFFLEFLFGSYYARIRTQRMFSYAMIGLCAFLGAELGNDAPLYIVTTENRDIVKPLSITEQRNLRYIAARAAHDIEYAFNVIEHIAAIKDLEEQKRINNQLKLETDAKVETANAKVETVEAENNILRTEAVTLRTEAATLRTETEAANTRAEAAEAKMKLLEEKLAALEAQSQNAIVNANEDRTPNAAGRHSPALFADTESDKITQSETKLAASAGRT